MALRNLSLFQAVTTGDTNAVKSLLSSGIDVNAANESGQTPLILAVVAGQRHQVQLLLSAGADPSLRDNTGLNAIDWAQRKGHIDLAQLLVKRPHETGRVAASREQEQPKTVHPIEDESPRPPLSADEKTRRFIAGLKRRLDEKANQETTTASSVTAQPPQTTSEIFFDDPFSEPPYEPTTTKPDTSHPETVPKSQPLIPDDRIPELPIENKPIEPAPSRILPPPFPARSSSARKRCPQCGATYNSELLAYCAYDAVALVGVDEPTVASRAHSSSPLVWILVLITLGLGLVAGLFVTTKLFRNPEPTPKVVISPPPATRKGTPALGTELSGKASSLRDAEVPANTTKAPASIVVDVKINRYGQVYFANSSEGDQVFRDAAVAAAKKSTFSPQMLRGRGAEGTITYTFK